MVNHKLQALHIQQVFDSVESKFQSIMEEILEIEKEVGTRQIGNFFFKCSFQIFQQQLCFLHMFFQ
jgi:hypothetical protein